MNEHQNSYEEREKENGVRHRKPRALPPVSTIPTLFTLANLVCGFAAIHYASKPIGTTTIFDWSTLTVAGLLVFVGMFFDSIDGAVARLTKSMSDVGAMLDSLSDIVTFGVAPALMMLRLVSHYYYGAEESRASIIGPEAGDFFSKIIWGIAAVYLCCTALRLARFMVETSSTSVEDHRVFSGLPTPGAAGAIASLIVLQQHLLFTTSETSATEAILANTFALGIPFVTLLCALAMISRLPYAHFVNRYLAPKQDFTWLAKIIIPLVFASLWPQITLAVGFTAYALTGPLALIRKRRSLEPEVESNS
jgi:CDP-diacylglycerol--serine O-phosphatidyltransferase